MDAARWNWLVSCHNMWCFNVESKALSKHSNNFPMCRHKNPLLPVIFHRQITPSAFFTVKSPARRCRIPTWDPSLTLWLFAQNPNSFFSKRSPVRGKVFFKQQDISWPAKIYVYLNLVMCKEKVWTIVCAWSNWKDLIKNWYNGRWGIRRWNHGWG